MNYQSKDSLDKNIKLKKIEEKKEVVKDVDDYLKKNKLMELTNGLMNIKIMKNSEPLDKVLQLTTQR